MPQQYQLNPDPGASLRALLSQLYDKFSAPRPQAQAIPGMNTRNMPAQSPLSRMLGGLATNNDAAGGNMYAGAGLPELPDQFVVDFHQESLKPLRTRTD